MEVRGPVRRIQRVAPYATLSGARGKGEPITPRMLATMGLRQSLSLWAIAQHILWTGNSSPADVTRRGV